MKAVELDAPSFIRDSGRHGSSVTRILFVEMWKEDFPFPETSFNTLNNFGRSERALGEDSLKHSRSRSRSGEEEKEGSPRDGSRRRR